MSRRKTNPFVYSLIDPRTGRPFYIGCGRGDRSKDHLRRAKKGKHRNKKLQGRLNDLISLGLSPDVEVLFSSADQTACFDKEVFYIAFYGRENLCNLSDGGHGGGNGAIRSPETRVKIGLAHSGDRNAHFGNPAHNRGKPMSLESRQKLSASTEGRPAWNKGKPMSEESKAKLSASRKGRPAWNKGKPASEEARAKMRGAALGKIISQETRDKMSLAQKIRWAGRKALEGAVNGTP